MAERQESFTAASGKEAEEANTNEAMWKDMEKKAAQELFRCHGHQFLLAAMRIILPAESDLAISERDNPVVGDSNAMCVAGQIMKNVLRAAERRLGVHDPVLAE